MPAADQDESMLVQDRAQFSGFARELVAELHAGEARGLGLAQTLFERNPAAQLLHVVIRPADRIGADADCHVFSPIRISRKSV